MSNNTIKIAAGDLVRGTNNIAGLIAEITKAGKALDRAIQIGLCSVVVHAHEHGDYTQANNIIDGLNKGLRTNAARDFLVDFAPVRWNKKTSKFVFDGNKRVPDFEQSPAFNKMMSTDWLSYRAENVKEFVPFDTISTMESMMKRIKKAMEDDRNTISEAELAIINGAFEALNAHRKAAAEEALLEAATAPDA